MTKLTQIEQETVIIVNEGEDTAHIETFNSRLKRRIKEVAAERPEDVTIESEKDGFLNAVFPKKWVKINPPSDGIGYHPHRERSAQQKETHRPNSR